MAKSKAKESESDREPTFEVFLEQLAEIVDSLESGELGLNESLEHYEQGVNLLKRCHHLLEKVERRIELLSGFDADGNPVTQAVEETSSLEQKQSDTPRSRRPQAGASTSSKPKKGPSPNHSTMDEGESLF